MQHHNNVMSVSLCASWIEAPWGTKSNQMDKQTDESNEVVIATIGREPDGEEK